tara:strand:- start:616 stop:726 length:111 start_codon:yes stop_codon:yes gene_type:complete
MAGNFLILGALYNRIIFYFKKVVAGLKKKPIFLKIL